MNRPKTICAECIHFINQGPIWYSQFCAASPLEKAIDPVTGAETYMATNSLGMHTTSDNAYQYCRDVNDGNCPKFEPKDVNLNGTAWDELKF